MQLNRLITLAIFAAVISVTGQAQMPVTESKAPVQVVKHKIGTDYYPMLDRPSLTTASMTAENGDLPITENERLARQRTRNTNSKAASAPIAPGDTRSRGRLRSYTRVIDTAELVQVELRNTEAKPIKAVDWDFAFPRYENGQLLLRFDVASKIEIKPGGKKTLKYHLPTGAKKCEVVKVISDENQPEKVSTFEAVCGAGFHDPSLLKQRQETISIKRIEYADGTIWQRKE
jgi:hypothetical protein